MARERTGEVRWEFGGLYNLSKMFGLYNRDEAVFDPTIGAGFSTKRASHNVEQKCKIVHPAYGASQVITYGAHQPIRQQMQDCG